MTTTYEESQARIALLKARLLEEDLKIKKRPASTHGWIWDIENLEWLSPGRQEIKKDLERLRDGESLSKIIREKAPKEAPTQTDPGDEQPEDLNKQVSSGGFRSLKGLTLGQIYDLADSGKYWEETISNLKAISAQLLEKRKLLHFGAVSEDDLDKAEYDFIRSALFYIKKL